MPIASDDKPVVDYSRIIRYKKRRSAFGHMGRLMKAAEELNEDDFKRVFLSQQWVDLGDRVYMRQYGRTIDQEINELLSKRLVVHDMPIPPHVCWRGVNEILSQKEIDKDLVHVTVSHYRMGGNCEGGPNHRPHLVRGLIWRVDLDTRQSLEARSRTPSP